MLFIHIIIYTVIYIYIYNHIICLIDSITKKNYKIPLLNWKMQLFHECPKLSWLYWC